ncbi:uncharacterized protein LOC123300620 [Chrysoperla carnea]|uniref:uncharacterized protein LOC123300620 n=1 Tax=Chrysoperla carnea TaxID=189513 RepID=UPI001D07A364|nr:uncharacterized protein LOC123300620 [Chrysoperla carnea]
MSESIHLATIKPDSLGTSWKASEKLNFRKKQTQDPTSGLPHKCACTRHGDVVTDICPCLDDDYHMPLLTLEKHESPDDSIKEKRTSITPGWETYVHVREFETEHGSSGTESDYLDDVVPVDRDQKIFCTGSNYVGQWNVLGMKGYGTYIMPHGVEYRGEFEDGQFHGNGILTYPNGLKIRGIFEKGKMIKWDLQFADGLEYNVPWNYCKMPDRRFYPEILDSIKPAGCSYITPEKPPREIPKGCYDTGDGYFDPNMKCIYSAYKPNKILRVASKLEEEWILANCRREEDCTTQYRPDLYTKLVTGCDEYTMEHKKSTETLDSDNIVDDMHEKYIIADLLDIPPIKSEVYP